MHAPDKPLAVATAPGKLILIGEHAAVYGRAAVAVPVFAVESRATIWVAQGGATFEAHGPHGCVRPAAGMDPWSAATEDAVAAALSAALARTGLANGPMPPWRIVLRSTIPIGVGLGSSAAVAVALVRAVAAARGAPLAAQEAAELALEAERRTHGTPSGIDNTVIALGRAVSFRRGSAAPVPVGRQVDLIIGDSGQVGLTRGMVQGVRERRDADPQLYDDWFDAADRLAASGLAALAGGDLAALGGALDANHEILRQMGVSTPLIDQLVVAARRAGALGAKLSGAGGGGVMLALVEPADLAAVSDALVAAGAVGVIRTRLPALP